MYSSEVTAMPGCAHADHHHWQPRPRVMVPVRVNEPPSQAGSAQAWPHAQANWHGPHPGYYSGQTASGPALTSSLSMMPAHHQADPWRSYRSHLAGVAAQAQPPNVPPGSLGHGVVDAHGTHDGSPNRGVSISN
jgi:hypothetical protein